MKKLSLVLSAIAFVAATSIAVATHQAVIPGYNNHYGTVFNCAVCIPEPGYSTLYVCNTYPTTSLRCKCLNPSIVWSYANDINNLCAPLYMDPDVP